MAFPWMAVPAALSAAGSLASMFGGGSNAEGGGSKKAKHHQLDYDRRRIKAIVDGAKDAGIHPLAAIGAASGGGGFAAPVGAGSGFGIGDSVGAGLRDLGSTFAELYESDQDRLERQEDRAYNESMRRRQNAIDTLRSKEVTPEVKLQRENMALQNDLLRMDIATSRTKLAAARAGAVGGTTGETMIGPLDSRITPDPRVADAQAIQDKYDDWVSGAYGVTRWLEDWAKGRVKIGPQGMVNPLTEFLQNFGAGSKKRLPR